MDHNETLDSLEALIDALGLSEVVDLLAEVASAKADHIQASYATSMDSEEPTAARWNRHVATLLRASLQLTKD